MLLYHHYFFRIDFFILFLSSFSISYSFYFHLSNYVWSYVALTALSRICDIASIIIIIITFFREIFWAKNVW